MQARILVTRYFCLGDSILLCSTSLISLTSLLVTYKDDLKNTVRDSPFRAQEQANKTRERPQNGLLWYQCSRLSRHPRHNGGVLPAATCALVTMTRSFFLLSERRRSPSVLGPLSRNMTLKKAKGLTGSRSL